ncbi:Gfo/Idh/MocA family oxidoreductase [Microbacterium sp. NEAU-LLC]|uniref:Gfo/Idh/MocA family oxidoreductase n=1 Tax=Microbacterium helvum TaxID=2773713 RepID=A0ABR8NSE8_9MICO|nr:Gfo/Idh/MocA family oxidoreductase [Microbacterium helvum]MBD3943564.1 Gfo/Idh/MocA family oxidoreductase [Microbacterium helvum]
MRGVGIIGAGPGVSALHLPLLAAWRAELDVVHVADAGSGRATALAERLGARSSSGDEQILADPRVEIVAICSPPSAHARQILAAVAAGKRAIFCEKPIALTRADAAAVVTACAEAGVALVVGTNHLFDPAWTRAKLHLDAAAADVRSISVTAALAPNDRYHRLVSDVPVGPPPVRPAVDLADRDQAADIVRQLVVGLGVHDLPLIRDLAPERERLVYARAVPPIGFDLGYLASGVVVRHSAVMLPPGADTLWRMSIHTDHDRIDIAFPPPFVHAGSAHVRVRDAAGRDIRYPVERGDGYEEEWRELVGVLRGDRPTEYSEIAADAVFAIELAEAAASAVLAGGGS